MASNLSDSQGYILRDNAWNNYLLAEGRTVPANAATGYATGCIFVHMDGGSATAVYVNMGSSVSANFDRVSVFPFNLSYGISSGHTTMLIPVDRTSGIAGGIAGRIAVAFDETSGSLIYIPVYYASGA